MHVNDSRKLYHIASEEYDVLKTNAMVTGEDVWYDKEVNFFLTVIHARDIKTFAKAGFSNYNMKHAYLYVVDPNNIVNYNHASITSTPEQQTWDEEHLELWDELTAGDQGVDFSAGKKEYMKLRRAELLKQYGILDKGDIEFYMNNKRYLDWSDRKWLDYNLKHGRKDQYATFIPHIQINTDTPIKYEKVVKLF